MPATATSAHPDTGAIPASRKGKDMPQLIENEDGTKTFAINSSELRALKDTVFERMPGLKKAVQVAYGPEVRTALGFLKSVIDS
jgi:hypothetical protein